MKFEDMINTIQLGDYYELIKNIPNESIDLIVTDPPYKITSRGGSGNMGGYWKTEKAKKGIIFDNNDVSCEDYLSQFYRVLKNRTICYVMCNNVNLRQMLNTGIECGFNFVKCLIWQKGNKICGRYYMGCYEYIILFRKGGDRPINKCGTPDILSIPIKKLKDENGKNLHDTEKPIELMDILIENSSNENDIVLDCFCGIGTTCISAKKLNRKFIGIEINKKYYDIANKRLNGMTADGQISIFTDLNQLKEELYE